MKETIKVERKENGKIVFQGKILRESQAELMNFIKDFYKNDNEVSTKLSQYLPRTVKIQLDVTRNNSKDIPSIQCYLENGNLEDIPVRRTHTIMWAIINKWFGC